MLLIQPQHSGGGGKGNQGKLKTNLGYMMHCQKRKKEKKEEREEGKENGERERETTTMPRQHKCSEMNSSVRGDI